MTPYTHRLLWIADNPRLAMSHALPWPDAWLANEVLKTKARGRNAK